MDPELNAALEAMADRIRTEVGRDIQTVAARLREDAAERETRLREELRAGDRSLGVLIESLRGDIQVVAEGVMLLDRKFDRLAGSEDRTRGRVDGLELRVLALEQAERERRRQT